MPRIADVFADCVFYVYNSMEDAQLERKAGASGFLVFIPLDKNPDWGCTYVITNRHVIMSADHPVIRLNRKDGKTECIPTKKTDWTLHPNGDDVAALALDVQYEEMRWYAIRKHLFVTPELVRYHDIGIGDNTFMVGRFINHEGIEENSPELRFGNIAMMPKQRIVDAKTGLEQEAFLVEMRSIPGYSGSPVLLFSTDAMMDMSKRDLSREQEALREGQPPNPIIDNGLLAFMTPKGPFLLGIDFCHIHNYEKVLDASGQEIGRVKVNTGMAGVVPAWKIQELLDEEIFVKFRIESDEVISKKKEESSVSLDSAETVFTEQDFEAALRKVSRRVDSSESGEETK